MKRFIYLLGIGISVLLVQFMYEKIKPDKSVSVNAIAETTLEKIFQNNNIHKADCEIDGYYYLGNRYYGESGSLELIDRVAERLGVNSEYYYDKSRTDTGSIAIMKKDGKNSSLTLELITVEYQESENVIGQRNYFSISLDIKDSLESGYYYKNLIKKTMTNIIAEETKYLDETSKDEVLMANTTDKDKLSSVNSIENTPSEKMDNNIYMVIKGKVYGEIDKDEEKRIAKEILDNFQAKEVFTGDDNENVNVYGYGTLFNEYVAIGSEKININVTFSYNEDENITYVYIGSPIVNYDY